MRIANSEKRKANSTKPRGGFIPLEASSARSGAADLLREVGPLTGFTLVELMVAMGVFGIIITIAVGGFSNMLRAQKQATMLIAANSNLSLALEQMTREMRTGYNFCPDAATCPDNHSIGFKNAAGEGVRYCFVAASPPSIMVGSIRRGAQGGGTAPTCDSALPITGDNVNLVDFRYATPSGVPPPGIIGANPGDGYPPRITISATASPTDPSLAGSFFTIQSTVSVRLIFDS